MALQGDFESIPLAYVLRLLSRAGKSGRLDIDGDRGQGKAWLRDGVVVGGALPLAPDSAEPADVVQELLRFRSGSFRFEGDRSVDGQHAPRAVDGPVEPPETVPGERRTGQSFVPPGDAWVSLAVELSDDRVVVTRDGWRVLVSVGRGATVRELAERLEMKELLVSWAVRDLADDGLIVVGTGAPVQDGTAASSCLPASRWAALAADGSGHQLHPSRDGWSYSGSHLRVVSEDPADHDAETAAVGPPLRGSSVPVATDGQAAARQDDSGDSRHDGDGDVGAQSHRSSLLRFLSSVKD